MCFISFACLPLLLDVLTGLGQLLISSHPEKGSNNFQIFVFLCFKSIDTENIKLVFCAVKDTIMQNALKEFNLAWLFQSVRNDCYACFSTISFLYCCSMQYFFTLHFSCSCAKIVTLLILPWLTSMKQQKDTLFLNWCCFRSLWF